ncbi:MAG: hypothetical protein MJE77_40975 [Proteobacteria bacterium]|nr:hypothetical protein [Pseudomonadota bacterium]
MSETLGAYVSISELEHELVLSYWPERFALQWSQCGRIPDVVAVYLASIGDGAFTAAYLRATVGYLLNELVENSVKFHVAGAIRIRVGFHDEEVVLVVTNQVTKEQKPALAEQFAELLQGDPEELFLAKVEGDEDPAGQSARDDSRLGLLSMMVDYQARLGWNFAPVANDDDKLWMQTMVRVPHRADQGN